MTSALGMPHATHWSALRRVSHFLASILEAMAHGKPVIGSDVGGTPELVIDGKTGWFYPAQDIMALSQAAEMATAPAAKLRKMGRCARRLIEREHDQAVVLPATAKAIIDLAARD